MSRPTRTTTPDTLSPSATVLRSQNLAGGECHRPELAFQLVRPNTQAQAVLRCFVEPGRFQECRSFTRFGPERSLGKRRTMVGKEGFFTNERYQPLESQLAKDGCRRSARVARQLGRSACRERGCEFV